MIKTKIKEIRKEEKISQEKLSEMIHVNQNTISQYESGKRSINSDILEDITKSLGYDLIFRKKDDICFKIRKLSHIELIKEMNESILKQTGINMDFEFELCSDGNLDLYARHIFSHKEVEELIDLGWIDKSIVDNYTLEYYSNPFDLDDYLELPNHLFSFILEKTYKEGTFISGVFDLDDYIEFNVSIPE